MRLIKIKIVTTLKWMQQLQLCAEHVSMDFDILTHFYLIVFIQLHTKTRYNLSIV